MTSNDARVFRTAHYDASGDLVRAAEAFPFDEPGDPRIVADLCARAADAGCTYEAGTFLVWADRQVRPPQRIEDAVAAEGKRSYGPQHPPVPARREGSVRPADRREPRPMSTPPTSHLGR